MKWIHRVRQFAFSSLFIYSLRCTLGFSIGYSLIKLLPDFDLFWSLLSIMLVISPEGKDSPRLTTERVKANLVGALAGLLVTFLPLESFGKCLAGIVLAAIICYSFKLSNVSRTAVVAVIIILLEKPGDGFLASIERFISVLGGCLIGLLVVIVTGYLIRYLHKLLMKAEFRYDR